MVGKRGSEVFANCEGCSPCLRRRARMFQGRMKAAAIGYGSNLSFLTLTYAPEHLPSDTKECSHTLTQFLMRFRMRLQRRFGIRNVKFAAVLERGSSGTKRFHWHLVVYGASARIVRNELATCWSLGFVKAVPFKQAHASYVAKYMTKSVGGEKPLIRWSRGLGYDYIKDLFVREYVRKANGKPVKVSCYYKLGGYAYPVTAYLRRVIRQLLLNRGVDVFVPTLIGTQARAAFKYVQLLADYVRRGYYVQKFNWFNDLDYRLRTAR